MPIIGLFICLFLDAAKLTIFVAIVQNIKKNVILKKGKYRKRRMKFLA